MCYGKNSAQSKEILNQNLTSFPGLPTVQFLIRLQYAKMEGEGLVHRQCLPRGGGGPWSTLRSFEISALMTEITTQSHSFDGRPPSVHLGGRWRYSCDKMDQGFPPSVFAFWKTERWEGLGTRLIKIVILRMSESISSFWSWIGKVEINLWASTH